MFIVVALLLLLVFASAKKSKETQDIQGVCNADDCQRLDNDVELGKALRQIEQEHLKFPLTSDQKKKPGEQ